jgi:acyl-coenzyme A synthetase/AMP-(fatty) acid ligase
MLPRRVYCVADLPRGDSGKIDRGALARRLRGLLRG